MLTRVELGRCGAGSGRLAAGEGCVWGVHFALQEIKLVLAAVYTEFETVVVEAESMVPTDGFVGRPRGGGKVCVEV